VNVVTGAFGYIGQGIARHLLARGEAVRTITTHTGKPNPFGDAVQAFPYAFDRPEALTESLRGVRTLYNTYWIRFPHGGATFEGAVRDTATLFACARRAGVERIVHIGVTNASPDSPLPYYRGKAAQEEALRACGVAWAVVRPTLVFGTGDILVNNIAWLLRTFPVFPMFGDGRYRLQPVFLDDLAEIAFDAGGLSARRVVDATGPESYSFEEFVRLIAASVRPRARIVHVPPAPGIWAGRMVGLVLGDVVLTRDELRGLMDELLTSRQPPNGTTRFSEWLAAHRGEIGSAYASEIARHFRYPALGSRNIA
jgi:NADH dehydrogenase